MKSTTVILGIMVGAAAGGILGILFAPEKGSKTRKQFLTKGEDLSDGVKWKLESLIDLIMNKVNTAKEMGEDILDTRKLRHNEMADKLKIQ